MQDSMRHQLYIVLSELEKSYPFTPEQLGYALVEDKYLEPKNLSNYRWIEDSDELVDLKGSHIEKNPILKAIVPTGLVHVWGDEYWPQNVNHPKNEEEVLHICYKIFHS
jgi:hypothetical protein